MNPVLNKKRQILSPLMRVRIFYVLILVFSGIIIIRLFYLQIIRHDHYQNAALHGQLKQYEIPASRGVIEAQDGDSTVPIVLNEKRYTLFADPFFITDAEGTSKKLAEAVGGNADDYEAKMQTPATRYVVLGKKLDKNQKQQIDELELKGVGTLEASYRTYPQGELAAQLLGFVDDEGEGKYGIEQALDDELRGNPGYMKAITDARGIPLVANKENVLSEPEEGQRIVLTIDIGMQQNVENILREGLEAAKSDSGSAVIMDARTGAIKAMANYPTYSPAEFFNVEDASRFTNPVVSAPLEVGSIMKVLTIAAGLNERVITPDTVYYDSGSVSVDGAVIKNVLPLKSNSVSIKDIISMSLNTGAVHILKQLGGGELNESGRVKWHDYMTNHFLLGKPTGIEQGYEEKGIIPDPKVGYGLNLQYANTAYGQGMSATMLQMAGALSSVLNDGNYIKPRLVDSFKEGDSTKKLEPEIVRQQVVRKDVAKAIEDLMVFNYESNYTIYKAKLHAGYGIGGKTGTAQIAQNGGYSEDSYNGTFIGFVGGDNPEYVIAVLVNDPKLFPGEFAGSGASAPIFGKIATGLIESGRINGKL